jgi:hypothetical protein
MFDYTYQTLPKDLAEQRRTALDQKALDQKALDQKALGRAGK